MTDPYKIKPLDFQCVPNMLHETWKAGGYIIERHVAPVKWAVKFYGRRVDEFGSLLQAIEAAQKHHLERITRYLEPVPVVAARPLEEWHEDMGDVLWWAFPVSEAPYVGTPLDLGFTVSSCLYDQFGNQVGETKALVGGWPGYHTHFTPLPPVPNDPALAQVEKADG